MVKPFSGKQQAAIAGAIFVSLLAYFLVSNAVHNHFLMLFEAAQKIMRF